MALRFVPRFTGQLKVIRNGQKSMGRDVSEGSLFNRIRAGFNMLSILVTWALENAIETSDSMRSRGYGLKGRTAFSIYKFTKKDKSLLAVMAALFLVFATGCMNGASYASYDPRILLAGFTIQGHQAPVSVPVVEAMLTYICFACFCFIPVILDVTETIRFARSRKHCETDLDMTYKKNLRNSGTGRIMIMNLVEVKEFSFAYPECSRKVLDHANLKIEEGTLNVICGRSGCGKSTLLRQLKTVLAPVGKSEGEIFYRGMPLSGIDHRTQSQEIGFVMQNPDNQIVTDKVWHELSFGLESLGYDNATIRLRVAEMASYFGIHQWFYKNVSELSGGQKQILNLAAIMAMHPSLLILDEPTSQLDPIAASDFLETVKKINRDIGTTVLLTEHRLQDIIPYADRVFVMDKGNVYLEGTPREIGVKLKEQKQWHVSFHADSYADLW